MLRKNCLSDGDDSSAKATHRHRLREAGEEAGPLEPWFDRTANRGLERAHPALLRSRHFGRTNSRRAAATAPLARPVAARFFRGLAAGERGLRRAAATGARWATAASAVVTPRRAIAAAIVAVGICLVVSQFLDYRAVEIGQPGYAGLGSIARPRPWTSGLPATPTATC